MKTCVVVTNMGVFDTEGVVYKPVDDVSLASTSDEVYLKANVKAPRMAGFIVNVFAWFLESRIFGSSLVYILLKNNLVHKLVSFAKLKESPVYVPLHAYEDLKEQEVKCIDSDLSPAERVKEAVDCIDSVENISDASKPVFRRWTILDYARAYESGQTTPYKVAERFLASVTESMSPALSMSFFINYNCDEILKQATESTL